MREDIHVRQIPGEGKRRWFSSENFDLVIWIKDDGSFSGFELCYDKTGVERSIIYRAGGEFQHMSVDDGEKRPGKYKSSPILVPDGDFDAQRIHAAFQKESQRLPREVTTFVLCALEMHPAFERAC